MEVKKFHAASLLMMLIVFLASQEMLCRGHERLCESETRPVLGTCRKASCRIICKRLGFENGICEKSWFMWLRHRNCICQKPCTAVSVPKGDAPGLPLDYSTNLRTTGLGR